MPIIKEFKTIPELLKVVAYEYGKTASHCALKNKTGDKYQEISYETLCSNTENFALGLVSLGVKEETKSLLSPKTVLNGSIPIWHCLV